MPGMTHPAHSTMPSTTATISSPRSPIAIVALGPTGQSLLADLSAMTPPGVQLLPVQALAQGRLGQRADLLILLAQQTLDADSQAMQALAQQAQDLGLGVHSLCVVVPPPRQASDKQKTLAHYALQALQSHVDATVVLPTDADNGTGVDLPAWLAQVVTDMAQSLGDSASITIDIDDLTRLLHGAGAAAWITVQASGPGKALQAAQLLRAHPWLAQAELSSARQVALWITAAPQAFKLAELRDIGQALRAGIHPDASHIYSVRYDAGLGDTLRLSALFTDITRR